MSDDSSTASKAEAGMVFSWAIMVGSQLFDAEPWKYQLEPLSARISP